MDESGTLLLANDTAVPPLLLAGLLACEKVRIPVLDTRYVVTVSPLNKKLNGMLCVEE
jgi:hypothetical protein